MAFIPNPNIIRIGDRVRLREQHVMKLALRGSGVHRDALLYVLREENITTL